MKVFVSQPMRGYTEEEILKRRNSIENALKDRYGEENIEIMDSYFKDFEESMMEKGTNKGLWYLGKSLQMMAKADIIVLCDTEYGARGCEIEAHAAREYGPFLMISERSLYDGDWSKIPHREEVACCELQSPYIG